MYSACMFMLGVYLLGAELCEWVGVICVSLSLVRRTSLMGSQWSKLMKKEVAGTQCALWCLRILGGELEN